MGSFGFDEHLADVLSRYDEAPDERLAEILRSLIAHLHAWVRDVDLSREEWFEGIRALRWAGDISDDARDEFILFSDTFGISMLVEMLAHGAAPGTTEPTVFGPFHVDGAPPKENGDTIVAIDGGDGEPLELSGVVRSLDGSPIVGATLDVWQTAPNGLYDVQDPSQPEMNLRGLFTTDSDGRYSFRTQRPVAYPIPGDGPAGQLLARTGRHNWRPAHIHFVVAAEGHKSVITHVFDQASEYLDSDAVFGVRDSLVVDMSDGSCEFDFVLEPV